MTGYNHLLRDDDPATSHRPEPAYPTDPGSGGPWSQGSSGDTKPSGGKAREDGGRLALSTLAAVAGTSITTVLDGSPKLRLLSAFAGAAIPAFVAKPGSYHRHRIAAGVGLTMVALFLTSYGGATALSYAANRKPIYPVAAQLPKPNPTTPTSTPETRRTIKKRMHAQ